jgi:hypothetical protein
MVIRTAVVLTTLGLSAGSALVVVPSATIEVHGASTEISVPAVAPLATVPHSTVDLGPVTTSVTVPSTGSLPPTTATGTVEFSYGPSAFGGLDYGLGQFFTNFGCGMAGIGGATPAPACLQTPWPAPISRITLPAGTRLNACPQPRDPAQNPPCASPQTLVTTAPASVALKGSSGPVPVRAVRPGAAGNVSWTDVVWVPGAERYSHPPTGTGLSVSLSGDVAGGADATGPAVSQADIDAARAPLRAALDSRLRSLAMGWSAPGETLLVPLAESDLTVHSNVPVGDAWATVTVSAGMQARATLVSLDSLDALAQRAVRGALHGRRLLAGTVRWDSATLQVATNGEPRVSITAHGVATGLDPQMVRSAAAWHGLDHVAEVVRRSDPQATVTVNRGFGWSPALVFLDRRASAVVDGYPE